MKQFHLFFGVAARNGNNRRSEFFKSVVKPERTREKSVTERDLSHVVIGHADRSAKTRNAVRPHIEVVAGITDDRGIAGRARRGVNADNLFHRLREKSVGVIVPDVAFFGIRYVLNIAERFYLVPAYARRFKALCIKRNVIFAVIDQML